MQNTHFESIMWSDSDTQREAYGLLCGHEGMDAAQRYRVAALDMGIGDSICRPRHWDDGRVGLPICNGWYYTWLGFSKCF